MISQELYQEILNSCGLSQAMKGHLEKQDLSKHDLIKLLVNAPVALTKKLTLLEQIAETEDLYEEMLEQVNRLLPGVKGHFFEWQSVWSRSATRIKGEIRKAIDVLQVGEGEFFWMEEHWFDYEWLDEKNGGGRAFQSLDAALQAIRNMMQEEEWDDATECWTELTKWTPGENGVMENLYRFYLIRDEVVYFSRKMDEPMKVFICGSKSLNYHISSSEERLSAVLSSLDCLMADGAEIIIGDCDGADTIIQTYLLLKQYRNVTVYASGANNRARNNIGCWQEKHFEVHKQNGYGMYIENNIHMAEDADCGLAILDINDRKSIGTILSMLCLAAQEKPCRVYGLNVKEWLEFHSLNDLGVYAAYYSGGLKHEVITAAIQANSNGDVWNYLKNTIRTIVNREDGKTAHDIEQMDKRLFFQLESSLLDMHSMDKKSKAAIIKILAEHRDFEIPKKTVDYIAETFYGDGRWLLEIVRSLYCRNNWGTEPSIDVAEEIIELYRKEADTVEDVLNKVARFYGITVQELILGRWKGATNIAKRVAVYLLREGKLISPNGLDELFGIDWHIVHDCCVAWVKEKKTTDPSFCKEMETFEKSFWSDKEEGSPK